MNKIHSDSITLENLQKSVRLCKKSTEDIVEELITLKGRIESHHGKVLVAKTSGTTATTLGTGLAVTGLVVTGLISTGPIGIGILLLGSAISIGGSAANLVTDIVDRRKRNNFIANMQRIAEEQQNSKEELVNLLEIFDSAIVSLMNKDISEIQAMFAVLSGDRYVGGTDNDDENKNSDDFEWVDNPKAWKPAVRKFCFKAGINSFKIVKNSKSLTALAASGRSMTISGARSVNAGAIATTNTVGSGIGRVIGHAAFKSTMAIVGVVFTIHDISLLVREWKATNPTQETVKAIIDEFNEEIEQYEKLLDKLDTIQNCKMFMGSFTTDIPIIGNSPFSVEALLSLCKLDFIRVESLYGEALELSRDDPKLQVLNIIYSQGLAVGPKMYEKVKEKLDTMPNPTEIKDGNHKDIVTNKVTNGQFAEPISDLELLLSKQSYLTEESIIAIPVFNLQVLEFNKLIIDTFLAQEFLPPFDILKKYLYGTTLLEDYENPLPITVMNSIKKVLISYCKHKGYLDANKFEYNLSVNLLQKIVISYLKDELSKMDGENGGTYYCDDMDECLKSNYKLEQITDFVEVLINHKSFIDAIAVEILCKNYEQQKAYDSVFTSVSKLFTHLQFKVPVWACDLHLALQQFSKCEKETKILNSI